MEIEVTKEIFRELKDKDDEGFNAYLRYKLMSLGQGLEIESEEGLKKKIEEVKERMTKMLEEISELQEFYEKAMADKENMEKWIDMIDEENSQLMEALKNGRDSD